jgi:hypothetical protein
MRLWLAVIVTLLTAPPIGATLTSVRSTADPLWFSNPSLGMNGTIKPIAGSRFEIVVIRLGDNPLESELRQFTLVTTAGPAYEPIAAGGGPDLIFPVDSMPVGREVGQILPDDSQVILTRTRPTSVTVEADPHATLAFVFQVPEAARVRLLKLPDGSELPLAK